MARRHPPLAAINTADVKPFRLVFRGGTALSRAHRLTRRMSEDIDLKIVSDEPRSRAELRKLRDVVTNALWHAGFQFDPENAAHRDSGNASRYTLYRLPYTPLMTGERCDRKYKSRQPFGRCVYHPSNGA
ncbi:MAG: nucleotidyl transferase AbiEii/AbiGii toxin family protein [Candidatus Sulfotelmatobacter sp.]